MKQLVGLLIVVLGISLGQVAHAIELFIWQPTDSHVQIVLGRTSRQSYEDAARAFLDAHNKNRSLVKLHDGKLKIPLEGFRDFDTVISEKPIVMVFATDNSMIKGALNSKPWGQRLAKDGAEVVVVPNNADEAMSASESREFLRELYRSKDSSLFLGGPDYDPATYGQKNLHAEDVTSDRDFWLQRVQKAFFAEWKKGTPKKNKPCFGICKGEQGLGIASGYKLIQDIKEQTQNRHDHVYTSHEIEFLDVKGSVTAEALGDPEVVRVKSQHHQAVDIDSNKKGRFKVVAVHRDEKTDATIVEIVEYKDGPGFATQFHPERMLETQVGRRLMKLMVEITEDSIKARGAKARRKAACKANL